jgi:hypothetical protein
MEVIDIFLAPNQLKYLQTMNQVGDVLLKKATKKPKKIFLVYSPKFIYFLLFIF